MTVGGVVHYSALLSTLASNQKHTPQGCLANKKGLGSREEKSAFEIRFYVGMYLQENLANCMQSFFAQTSIRCANPSD